MAHEHLADAKRTQSAKVEGMLGHTKGYLHPSDKGNNMANSKSGPYFENRKLDPAEVVTKDKVGP